VSTSERPAGSGEVAEVGWCVSTPGTARRFNAAQRVFALDVFAEGAADEATQSRYQNCVGVMALYDGFVDRDFRIVCVQGPRLDMGGESGATSTASRAGPARHSATSRSARSGGRLRRVIERPAGHVVTRHAREIRLRATSAFQPLEIRTRRSSMAGPSAVSQDSQERTGDSTHAHRRASRPRCCPEVPILDRTQASAAPPGDPLA